LNFEALGRVVSKIVIHPPEGEAAPTRTQTLVPR
jgi:hypothetical protein